MSVKVPPLMLGEETSSTPPSQKIPLLISVLKLLRESKVAEAELTMMLRETRYLSVTPFWSSTNALLGGVSETLVTVIHFTPLSGGAPLLVAVHPEGRAGAVTPSKFSRHGGAGVGVAVGAGVGVEVGGGVGVDVPPGVGVAVGAGVGVADPPGVGVGPGVGPGAALRSYTSTMPMPVVLFSPDNSAVYRSGGRFAAIAASFALLGANPAAVICAACAALSCQSLSEISNDPFRSRSSRVGSARTGDTPRLGPRPRMITWPLPPLLPSMNPAITMLFPVPENARVLMLASFELVPWVMS